MHLARLCRRAIFTRKVTGKMVIEQGGGKGGESVILHRRQLTRGSEKGFSCRHPSNQPGQNLPLGRTNIRRRHTVHSFVYDAASIAANSAASTSPLSAYTFSVRCAVQTLREWPLDLVDARNQCFCPATPRCVLCRSLGSEPKHLPTPAAVWHGDYASRRQSRMLRTRVRTQGSSLQQQPVCTP